MWVIAGPDGNGGTEYMRLVFDPRSQGIESKLTRHRWTRRKSQASEFVTQEQAQEWANRFGVGYPPVKL
jgi:hypothetical protein